MKQRKDHTFINMMIALILFAIAMFAFHYYITF
jgi:hypothetical protein